MNNNWAKFEPDYTFKVKTVYVRQYDDGNYFYNMDITKKYNQISLEDIRMPAINDSFIYNENFLEIAMNSKNSIDGIRNNNGCVKVEALDNSVDKFITLKSALEEAEQKMSGFKSITISDIEIKYTLKLKDYSKEIATFAPGNIVNGRPVWSFIIDVDESEIKATDGNIYANNPRKFINVDMITGEIFVQMEYL